MTKLWQKGYQVNERVERFEAEQNSMLDTRLVRHDVWGSLAHVAMLQRIGVLSEAECQALQEALRGILDLEESQKFTISHPMRMYIPVSRTTWLRPPARQARRSIWRVRATTRCWLTCASTARNRCIR